MVFCEYLSYVDEIRPQYQLNAPSANAIFSSSIVRNNGASLAAVTAELDNQVTNLDSMWTLATPSYSDQVLPFNVTLTGANEYGAMTAGKILGIEILNEVGLSVLPDNKNLARGRGSMLASS